MSNLKPIIVHCHVAGPNPKKIIILLEELNVPYTAVPIGMPALKQEPFTLLNPNGRAPAIEDPNTGVTLWESGAIAMYLVETYDPTHKLHHATGPERFAEWQWTAFQISGQGPYFGQAYWFLLRAPEKIPHAIDRYTQEIDRVTSVLDGWLSSRDWLVGDRLTYADLMFVPWAKIANMLVQENIEDKYPHYGKWLKAMTERESVKKTYALMEELAKKP